MFRRANQFSRVISNPHTENALKKVVYKRNLFGCIVACSSAIGSLYYCWWRGYKCEIFFVSSSKMRHVPLLERPPQYRNTVQPSVDYMKYPLSVRIIAMLEILGVGIASRILHIIEDVKINGNEKVINLIHNRPAGVPLITVTNHESMLDEPLIISIMGMKVLFHPNLVKWTLATEDVCFSSFFRSTFFSIGKVMPIQRGGGLFQVQFTEFIDRAKYGDWLHIYPEGRIYQDCGYLKKDENGSWVTDSGRKSPPGRRMGPLKWGVGRLILESPTPPILIPIYHLGMNKVVPQGPDNLVIDMMPKMGKKVFVEVGDEVHFDDILERYKDEVKKGNEVDVYKYYIEITDRVDKSLEKLEYYIRDKYRNEITD